MKSNILYEVVLTTSAGLQSYELYGRSKNHAKALAVEIHNAEHWGIEIDSCMITEVKPSDEEISRINKKLINVYGQLKHSITGKGYKDFVNTLYMFNGYNADFGSQLEKSFYINFRGFICRILFMNGETIIDEEEIVYVDEKLGKTFVIRNNLIEFYIGV